jgi:hypothetical protein
MRTRLSLAELTSAGGSVGGQIRASIRFADAAHFGFENQMIQFGGADRVVGCSKVDKRC